MRLLTELNQEGTTIVMVTPNEHAARMAHRIIRLFDGHIVEGNCPACSLHACRPASDSGLCGGCNGVKLVIMN